MSFEKYFQTPTGKSFILSSLIALASLIVSFLLPLAPYNEGAWYLGLYKDFSLPDEDRMNGILVFLEILFLCLFYFHTVIAFGNLTEVQNNLPGWKEIIFPFAITFMFAFFVPRISTTGNLVGGQSDTGFNHFTPAMSTLVLWLTTIFSIGIIFYLINSKQSKE